jgi:hypothetical protein
MISDYGDGSLGAFNPGKNLIDISYEVIKSDVISWNVSHPAEAVTLDNSIESLLLHEICHLLIDGYERDVDFDVNGNTIVDISTIGVRDILWRENPNHPKGKEPDMKNYVNFARLLVNDIRDIQFHSKARD